MADRNLELALRIRALVDGEDNIEDLRKKLGELSDELKDAANPADEFNQGLRDIEKAGQQAGRGVKAASDPMEKFKELLGEIAIAAVAKQILDLNDQLSGLQRGFEVITGSSEAASQSLDFVRGVADRLGTSTFDLAQSFLKITAAAKGTQLEGAATEQIFSALAGAMSTVGASAQDVDAAMNAVAQIMSKGVVSAEELRGQLGDVLPGAAKQAADALLVTNAEFNKMLESGEVIASEFLPKFATQLEKSLGGGGKAVETFNAAWNRLLNQLTSLATGDVGRGFTALVTTLTDGLGVATKGLVAVGDTLGAVGKLAGGLASGEVDAAFADFGQNITEASGKLFGLQTETQVAAERQKQMAAELKAVIPEIDRLQNAVGRRELQELPETLQAAIAEIRKTGQAADATALALKTMIEAPQKNLDLDSVVKLATGIKALNLEAKYAGQEIAEGIGAQLTRLTDQQLTALERQARAAWAAAGDDGNARAVFSELGQILEGVVLARLQRLGVDGTEALRGISANARQAMADFTALAENSDLSAETIAKAFEGALAILDNPEELTAFRARLQELGDSGALTAEQVADGFAAIRQRLQEVATDAAFERLAAALALIREETEAGSAASERQNAIDAVRIKSAIALAKAKGDETEATRLTALALQDETDRARERIRQLDGQIAGGKEHINLLYQQANADGVYSDAEREVIETLKDLVAEKEAERAQITAILPLRDREREAAERAAGPIGQLTRLYADSAREHERAAAASEAYYQTQLNEIDGAIRVAETKGDEVEAASLVAEQRQIQIDQAADIAAARQQEALDAQNAVSAKRLELAADGELSAADQQQIADLEAVAYAKGQAAQQALDHVNSLRAEADAARETASVLEDATQRGIRMEKEWADAAEERAANAKAAGDFFGGYLTSWAKYLEGFSAKAREAFDGYKQGADLAEAGTEELNAALMESMDNQAAYSKMLNGGLAVGLFQWTTQVANSARDIEQAFLSQRIEAQKAIDTLTEYNRTGVMTGSVQQAMIQNSGDLAAQFDLLDDQDLNRLRAALDAANDKLAEMQGLVRDARERLAELNAELLEAKGEDEKAALLRQQLDYQQQLAEIETQIAQAQAAGNQELLGILREQKATLEAINRAKLESIKADAQSARSGETASKSLSSIADEAERASVAVKSLSLIDLSNLSGQTGLLRKNFTDINSLL